MSSSAADAGTRTTRVFLSYREDDGEVADQLREAARAIDDIDVYSCPFEGDAADWRKTCRRLIEQADAVICVVGPTTGASPNVDWELREAMAGGRRIVLAGPGATELAAKLPTRADAVIELATPAEVLDAASPRSR